MSISRWYGRVAVVTGASTGIGAVTAVELCKNGLITIGLARRVERIEQLKSQLTPEQQKNFYGMKCDVSNEAEIVRVFDEITAEFGGIDVLINNAGVLSQTGLTNPDNSEEIHKVINTNVFGIINCTREAVKSIRKRNSEAHIIHINSVDGHFMPYHAEYSGFGIYSTSKFAVTALAEQHRQEFIKEKLNIKVSSLSPGAVMTEIANNMGLPKETLEEMQKNVPFLKPIDIANSIIYVLNTPQNVLITELTIRPMNETF